MKKKRTKVTLKLERPSGGRRREKKKGGCVCVCVCVCVRGSGEGEKVKKRLDEREWEERENDLGPSTKCADDIEMHVGKQHTHTFSHT